MHRKPASALSYTHEVLKPIMAQAFATPRGIPDVMRAALGRLDQPPVGGHSLTERLEAVRVLTEGRDAQAPSRART